MALVFLLSLVIRLPFVQSWLVKQSTGILYSQLGIKVELEEVQMALPVQAELAGVRIYDPKGNELIQVSSLRFGLLSFSLWKYLLQPDQNHILSLQDIELDQPVMRMYKGKQDSSLNLQLWLDQILGEDTTQNNPAPLLISFPSITLQNGLFFYVDSTSSEIDTLYQNKLNFHHLQLHIPEANLSMNLRPAKELGIQISRLKMTEFYSGFTIHQLNVDLLTTLYGQDSLNRKNSLPSLELADLSLISGNTRLQADIRFPERELSQIFDFEDDIAFDAILKKGCRIDMGSLEYMSRDSLPVKGILYAEGQIDGTWQELNSNNLLLRYGRQTELVTRFRIQNYMEPEQTRLDIHMNQSEISFLEIQDFLPNLNFPKLLTDLDLLDFEGNFWGSYKDFHVQADLDSEFGELTADLKMQLPPVVPQLTYEGSFQTKALNVDVLSLSETSFSKQLSVKGTAKGKGASLEDLAGNMNVLITDSELAGREVDSLRAILSIQNQDISGSIEGADRSGYVKLDIQKIDLSVSPPVVEFDGICKNLRLQQYVPFPEDISLSSDIQMGTYLNPEDSIIRFANLENLLLHRNDDGRDLLIPNLRLQDSSFKDKQYFNLQSSLFRLDLLGHFQIQEAIELTQQLIYENLLYFTNEDSLLEAHYAEKDSIFSESNYEVTLIANQDLSETFSFFNLPVGISKGSEFKLEWYFGEEDSVKLFVLSDSTSYESIQLTDSDIHLYLRKHALKDYPIVLGDLYVGNMQIGPRFLLEDLELFTWRISDNYYESELKTRQTRSNLDVQLRLFTFLAEDGAIQSHFDSDYSSFRYWEESGGKRVWKDSLLFGGGESLIYANKELFVQNLILENDNQYFRLNGLISEAEDSEIIFSISQLNLDILSELYPFPYEIGGLFNADIKGIELLGTPKFELISRVDEFALNEYAYGEVSIQSHWQEEQERINLDAQLVKDQDTTLKLQGYYSLVDTISPILMTLLTEGGFPLEYALPFVEDQLYEIGGNVKLDSFEIKGPPDHLTISGTGEFEKATFGVSYFQTEYTFDGKIEFDTTFIRFPRLRLYDQDRSYADLHGLIRHRGLREFDFDLQVDSVNHFLLMDTRKQDNEAFYGKLYLNDGLASITGDLDQISIQAITTTGAGSSLKIPVSDYEDFGKPEYIYFVGKGDGANEDESVHTDLQGFELDLTVLATKEAEVELIFDERAGDVIKGKGEGSINLFINESGDFTMFGDYEISQGDYLFTSQNVINKKFRVKEGGKITWNGDPFDADLDLNAVYPLKADLKYLLQSSQSVRTDVNVQMHMTGLLSKPEIELSIELPNIRSVDAENAVRFLRNIHFDEQELNKQVFSLMVFNRFAPIGGDLGDNLAGLGVTTSISELLSNQLNLLLSQVTGDKVDVNVNTSDFQDLNLLVSARLFDDRVTLERDGTLVQGGSESPSRFSIGNIRIIIRLLPGDDADIQSSNNPSEMVLEVFTRENFSANAQGSTFTQNQTGLGIFFKKDFDHLSDLLKRGR